MRVFLILISVFYVSFSSQKVSNTKGLADEISNYNLESIDTLVDIGCQNGEFSKELLLANPKLYLVMEDLKEYSYCDENGKNCKYYNTQEEINKVFLKKKNLNLFKNRYKFIAGTTDSIPLPTNSCKVILCRKTIHEFSNSAKMISELYRVLEKGGLLMIVEAEPKYPNQKDENCKHKYLTRVEVINLFKQFKYLKVSAVYYKGGEMNLYKYSK